MFPMLSETRLIGPFINSLFKNTCLLLSGVIFIIELSVKEAIYKFPFLSAVIPVGLIKLSYTPEYCAILDGALTGFCGGAATASLAASATSLPF